MTRKYINEAKHHAAVALGEATGKGIFSECRAIVDYLQRAGATLHTRYEAACSYEWADTPEYERHTEKREATLLRTAKDWGMNITTDCNERRPGVWVRLQTDPRGWPVVLYINGREHRLGGK